MQTSKSKRARKPKKRIHYGEIDLPQGEGSLQGARNIFLRQVAKLVPGVLDDLSGGPLCDFSRLALSERLAMPLYVLERWKISSRFEREVHSKTWQWAVFAGTDLANVPQIPAGRLYGTARSEQNGSIDDLTLNLFRELWQWQEKYNLKAFWVLFVALETLIEWAEFGLRNSKQLNWRLHDRIERFSDPGSNPQQVVGLDTGFARPIHFIWGPGSNPQQIVILDSSFERTIEAVPNPNPPSMLFPDVDDYNPVIMTRREYIEKRRRQMLAGIIGVQGMTETDRILGAFCRQTREYINGVRGARLAGPSVINSLIEAATENLEQRCKEVERWYVARGFKSTPDKRELEKHMRWAVKFQVRGRNFSEVAAEEDDEIYEVSTVSRAAKDALRLIGLSPRPDGLKRGRRPGRKASPSAKLQSAVLRGLGR